MCVGARPCPSLRAGRSRSCSEIDRAALPGKDLGERLHQFLIVAVGRADGNAQRGRLQQPIQRARSDPEQEDARGKDQKRITFALRPPPGNARISVCL